MVAAAQRTVDSTAACASTQNAPDGARCFRGGAHSRAPAAAPRPLLLLLLLLLLLRPLDYPHHCQRQQQAQLTV